VEIQCHPIENKGSVDPGIKAHDAKATTQEVKITIGNAKLMMTRSISRILSMTLATLIHRGGEEER